MLRIGQREEKNEFMGQEEKVTLEVIKTNKSDQCLKIINHLCLGVENYTIPFTDISSRKYKALPCSSVSLYVDIQRGTVKTVKL